MGDSSAIEWTEATWNPIAGCSLKSSGCKNCYAMREAHRLGAMQKKYAGLTKLVNGHPVWTGELRLWEPHLEQPHRWKKPRRIFVNSMSDLFHEAVPDEWICRIFEVMGSAKQHTYQILTKRPERMRAFVTQYAASGGPLGPWPWPQVWLGVSVEDQATADERIPLLLRTSAKVRWVSYEPALAVIDRWKTVLPNGDTINWLTGTVRPNAPIMYDPPYPGPHLDWIVVGGESGPGARPFDLAWARQTVAQGREARVPVFVKQLGREPFDSRVGPPVESRLPMADRKGGDPAEWPEDLRGVREYPGAA